MFAAKFAPYSALMSSFNKGSFRNLIIGLSVISIASFSYGIYHYLTYQPSFLDIQVEGKDYTIFGDIGEFGYFADRLPKKGEEIELYFVSWENLTPFRTKLIVDYPSGVKENWNPSLSIMEGASIEALKEKHDIEQLFQASAYTFKEAGKVTIFVVDQNGKVVADYPINVQE